MLSVRLSPTYCELHAQIVEETRIQVNAFFPGWKLYVDGAERPIGYDNIQAVIEFSLEQGEHVAQVFFRDTPVRSWNTRLSLLAPEGPRSETSPNESLIFIKWRDIGSATHE